MTRTVVVTDRLVTCDPRRASAVDPLGVLAPGVVAFDGGEGASAGRVSFVGTLEEASSRGVALPSELASAARAPLVTPGLVDAHTHAPYAGSRHAEYALRLAGAGYEEIARSGGGIVSTMRAVRAASAAELTLALEGRLARMASLGVTTVECKSGYGLDVATERRQLEAIARARSARAPRLVATYLGLHALPPEAAGDRDGYAKAVTEQALPELAPLAEWVDAYVDRSAFSVAQAEPFLVRARELGLGVRLHVGQFADVGGAELAARVGAASIDHAEHVSNESLDALARAGVKVALLPLASFTLGQAPPRVAAMRERGLGLVVASDANPGTAPTESLPLALAFAARTYGLSVGECVLGATRLAAESLSLPDVGFLREGARADLVAWDLPHEAALVQPWGASRTLTVVRDGVVLHRAA